MERPTKRAVILRLKKEIEEGKILANEVAELLLDNPGIDPSADENFVIDWACRNGYAEIVRLLLADARVDPAHDYSYPLTIASANGRSEVVRLLLADKRVDPSEGRNNAIQIASHQGHAEVVRLLLADERVDPGDVGNVALIHASERGHADIVRLLLADNRVDPTDSNNLAILKAYSQPNVLLVLFDDGRADWRLIKDTPTFQIWRQTHPQIETQLRGYEEGLEDVVQPMDIRTKIAREAEYIRFCKDLKHGQVPPYDLYELASILGITPFHSWSHTEMCNVVRKKLDSIGIAKPLPGGRL